MRTAGTIRTAGGDGDVTYRFVYPHRPSAERTIHFDDSGGQAVSETLRLIYDRVGPRGIRGDVTLQVLAPDVKRSDNVSIDIRCQRPKRGVHPYQTDGYRARIPSRVAPNRARRRSHDLPPKQVRELRWQILRPDRLESGHPHGWRPERPRRGVRDDQLSAGDARHAPGA